MSEARIHPTAVVHPEAVVHPSATVGPHAVIDAHVELGADCLVGPGVHLTGHTVIGAGNRFHAGCVIGDEPQDLKYEGQPTRLSIGDRNVFREHVTVHRANKLEEDTVIGSGCLLMAGCHVGHNSVLGDRVIVTNGSLIAGHVQIGDRAILSGNCMVHQFVRIGTLAMMQGGAGCAKDLPPFCMARWGLNRLCGLNTVGLRRAGFTSEERLELKRLYHTLFRSGAKLEDVAPRARELYTGAPARAMLDFLEGSTRGFCTSGA
jgi:UDP-N-acetylglucosamine acyltransferase